MTGRISLAARVAGLVVSSGYLLGIIEGPLMMVMGGLALITFGRGLAVDREHEALAGTALAVIAASLGVAALRWGTFDLGELRGAQGVLGPTLLVGPQEIVSALAAAAAGGFVAVVVWLAESPEPERERRALWLAEAACGAAALVVVFWGPAARGVNLLDLGSWVVVVATTTAAAIGGGLVIRRARRVLAWSACCVAAMAAVAGALLVAAA